VNHFECLVPILNVKNFAASIDYYIHKLGFSKKWDWGTPPTFGCVTRGDVDIFFCQGGQGQPGMWMSIFVDNVDALHEEYKKSGATVLAPPTNMPWGTREMNVLDPDGNHFRMGSHATAPADEAEVARFWQAVEQPQRSHGA
jgi:predicted enzyme related to lactoylglutathione lyase